jgi:hypothetical protein
MRTKEKEEYVTATESILGQVTPELHNSLLQMNSRQLIQLAKTISEKYGVGMPNFPTRTETQRSRLNLKVSTNESKSVSGSTLGNF